MLNCYVCSFETGNTGNLWWSVSPGGVVTSSCGSSNALVFGTGLMNRVAVTKPLAIHNEPTIPVVLHEGFDDTGDITRLVTDGYVKIL